MKQFIKAPMDIKLLLTSNFMICGSLLMVSIYSTLWMGIAVLEVSDNAHSKKQRNKIFDMGISWGSITLAIASMVPS